MITVNEIMTATDRGYESIADIQYGIALKSRVSGDVNAFNQGMVKSMEIYANINAIEGLDVHVSQVQDRKIELLFRRIQELTKDIKTWD